MNNDQDIPENILEMLASRPFSGLSAEEQDFVRPYMDAAEYDEMHLVYCAASVFAARESSAGARRAEILRSFDLQQEPAAGRGFSLAWKVAVVLATIFSALAVRMLLPLNERQQVVTKTDTVFVDRPGPLVIRHDTVFKIVAAPVRSRVAPSEIRKSGANQLSVAFNQDIEVLPFSEVSGEAAGLKGNSLLYDSLASAYEFSPM